MSLSDEQIAALWPNVRFDICEGRSDVIEFARAILAAAAQGQEPQRVYLVASGMANGSHDLYERHENPPPFCDYETLYTSPPPVSEPRWVPVSERLPAPETMVLAAFEMDGPGDWRIKCACYEPDSDDLKPQDGWRIFGGGWRPTHWTHLPAPPQGPAALADSLDEAMQPDARDALLRQALEALLPFAESTYPGAMQWRARDSVAAIRNHLGERT